MNVTAKFQNISFILLFSAALLSCDPWFAYSPYDAQVGQGYRGTTEENLTLIGAVDVRDSKPFKIAVLADAHYHYDKLRDAVLHINRAGDYDFAIVVGDLTENGLKQEFIFFHEAMANLKIPYVTVIGNHDYLSNGEKIYNQMYGRCNYSFAYNNVKVVMFDNNTYESGKEPDMEWLAQALVNDHGYDHVIPVSHIPPFDGQMTQYAQEFRALMAQNGIEVSIHGHKHDFSVSDYGDGVRYVTVSSPQKRSYTGLSITPAGIEIRKIEY